MNNQTAINKTLKAIKQFNLIEEDDKIAVGLSGGKDSLFMLKILNQIQKFYDKHFELTALCVDMQTPHMNLTPAKEFCKQENIKLVVIPTDIYEVVFNIKKEKNPCSLCAKLRRGILCSKANELGFNKLALGHNSDDLIETFFLSLLYEGRLSTIAPKSYLSNTKITVIRPIILFTEQEVKDYAKDNNLPITQNFCPANHHTKREETKQLMQEISKKYPISKQNIFNAITSPSRYNLWKK